MFLLKGIRSEANDGREHQQHPLTTAASTTVTPVDVEAFVSLVESVLEGEQQDQLEDVNKLKLLLTKAFGEMKPLSNVSPFSMLGFLFLALLAVSS